MRIELLNARETSPAELPIADVSGPAVTRVGDLWLIGRHRLLCGDARSEAAHRELMGIERAAAVFPDPPITLQSTAMSLALAGFVIGSS